MSCLKILLHCFVEKSFKHKVLAQIWFQQDKKTEISTDHPKI